MNTSKMNIKFIYINVPFWRAEIGRISLFLGNIEYEDLRINREEFMEVREKGKLYDGTIIPFRQLPCIIVDGKSICQTGGISRFCGKQSNLYPTNNDVEAALVDQVIDMASDITDLISNSNLLVRKMKFSSSVSEKMEISNSELSEEENKKFIREELYNGPLLRKVKFLEDLLDDNNNWFVGNKISIADIAIWRFLGWLSSGTIDYFPTDMLKNLPYLKKICNNVNDHPGVKEWIKLKYPDNYPLGNFS